MEQQSAPNRLSRQELDRLLGSQDSEDVHQLLEEWRSVVRGEDLLDALAGALNTSFDVAPRTREDILMRASQILEVVRSVPPAGRSVSVGVVGSDRGTKTQRLRGRIFTTRPLRSYVSYVAASAIVVGALGLVLSGRITLHTIAGEGSVSRPVSTYATTNGQRANITLLDGTTVILNVASRLDVPAGFAAGDRTVHLAGEALFTVNHHHGTPFTVVAGQTTTSVLGTTFSVRRYATDSMVTVAVRDGKVAVGATVLTAWQSVEVSPSHVSPIRALSPSAFGFATGTLSLPQMSLRAAISALDRWYDADIRLGNPVLATQSIKGDFDTGSLGDLAQILAVAFDVRVVRHGRVLTLYPRTQR